MNKYMKLALKEAEKAFFKQEIPVGAVLVKNDKVVAKSHNNREKTYNILSHAEINCIKKAANKTKSWKLDDFDLYVTLKPCSMCENVIKQARIRNVYYLIDKLEHKLEFSRTNVCELDCESEIKDKYKLLFSDFFKNRRK